MTIEEFQCSEERQGSRNATWGGGSTKDSGVSMLRKAARVAQPVAETGIDEFIPGFNAPKSGKGRATNGYWLDMTS